MSPDHPFLSLRVLFTAPCAAVTIHHSSWLPACGRVTTFTASVVAAPLSSSVLPSGTLTTTVTILVVIFAVGLVVSTLTTPAGISGAIILVPVELLALGLTGPAVCATTLLYNVIAMPAGIWRHHRSACLTYSLVGTIALGSLPGVVLGVVLRTTLVWETARFQTLLAILLAALAMQMLWRSWHTTRLSHRGPAPGGPAPQQPTDGGSPPLPETGDTVPGGRRWAVGALAFLTGGLSGIFGIGGGSFVAPALVTVLRQPVRTISDAALFSTFLTSLTGLATFTLLGPLGPGHPAPVYPYWQTGIALGLGGLIGSQLGAALQTQLPERLLTLLLTVLLLTSALILSAGLT